MGKRAHRIKRFLFLRFENDNSTKNNKVCRSGTFSYFIDADEPVIRNDTNFIKPARRILQ